MNNRLLRRKRIRAKIKGTVEFPRLSVFRSNKHIYGQIINDQKGDTLVTACDKDLKSVAKKQTKIKIAQDVGKVLAQNALKKKIKNVLFDRGGYKFHGRVKALAEGARKGGLKF